MSIILLLWLLNLLGILNDMLIKVTILQNWTILMLVAFAGDLITRNITDLAACFGGIKKLTFSTLAL